MAYDCIRPTIGNWNKITHFTEHSQGPEGNWGTKKRLGGAQLQIPFEDRGLVIDVVFFVLEQNVPSLLYNRNMIDYGLDICLQGRYIHVGQLHQPFTLENYFLKHRCSSSSTPFALYTEQEVRHIPRGLDHPSVHDTESLLRRASRVPLTRENKKELEK